MRKVLLTFFILFSTQAYSSAEFSTTLDLLNKCNFSKEYASQASQLEMMQAINCLGYLSGIFDGISLIFGVKPESKFFCPPQGISAEKALSLVRKWIENNPQDVTTSARMTLLIAYAKEYPC